uniref:Xeroderma pigmentosum, complementation group C n=1 Tax=Sinocyclocheilus grahami TaxID=75366 RepID=A0A672P9S0_SINGR
MLWSTTCLSVLENRMVDKNNRKNSRVASRASRKVKDSSDERTSKYFQDSDHSSPSKQIKEDKEENEDEEEVKEPLGPVDSTELAVVSKPIEIETPDMARKRQRKEKRKTEFETFLRRMMKRFNKDLLVDTHKVHLLCLLAGGLFRNRLCCEPDLLAVALSILPAHFTTVATKRMNNGFLE